MKGGGHGGITARGRTVGVRGNINRQVVARVPTTAVPQVAAATGARGPGLTRLNVRGTTRGKPQQNLPGEDGCWCNDVDSKQFSSVIISLAI